MRFKDFILKEEFGLGDFGSKIDTIFNSGNSDNIITGALNNSAVSNANGQTSPSNEIEIPQIERTGRITVLLKNRNPILVRLSDGTEASFTYDEYRRIEGEPSLGKTMTIMFQRHANDGSKSYSKVDKCIVKD